MKKFWEEFKSFAMKGNVIDLAVGIIIGGAFGKIVSSLVDDIVMPLLGLIIGKVNFTNLKYVIIAGNENTSELAIKYGKFIQSVIDFTIVAFAIFILIKVLNAFRKKEEVKSTEKKPIAPPKEEILLEEIRDILKSMKS